MTDANTKNAGTVRYVLIAGLVVAAFFGAYRFAGARSAGETPGQKAAGSLTQAVSGDPSGSVPGCSCCGSTAPTENGITGDPVEGAAVVEGDSQSIDIDLSAGYYQPNVIKLAAGVPAKVTFGQSSGCTGQVMSEQLGFFEDLTTGPVTVELPALEAGEYEFSCGMAMVFGKIVVE